MRLIDADEFEVVGTKIPDGMDAESYMAGMDFILNKIDEALTIEPEVKFIRLPNENPVDMFPLLTAEEKQQSREYAQGYSDALAELKKGERMSRIPTQNEKELFAELLKYAADCIQYYNRVSMLPDCNNCKDAYAGCIYMPSWGEDVRINCPHWKSEEDAT